MTVFAATRTPRLCRRCGEHPADGTAYRLCWGCENGMKPEPPLCVCDMPDVPIVFSECAQMFAGVECRVCRRPFFGYHDPLRDEWRAYLNGQT